LLTDDTWKNIHRGIIQERNEYQPIKTISCSYKINGDEDVLELIKKDLAMKLGIELLNSGFLSFSTYLQPDFTMQTTYNVEVDVVTKKGLANISVLRDKVVMNDIIFSEEEIKKALMNTFPLKLL